MRSLLPVVPPPVGRAVKAVWGVCVVWFKKCLVL